MKVFPSKVQWKNWKLLSRFAYIGVWVTIFLGLLFVIIQQWSGAYLADKAQMDRDTKFKELSLLFEKEASSEDVAQIHRGIESLIESSAQTKRILERQFDEPYSASIDSIESFIDNAYDFGLLAFVNGASAMALSDIANTYRLLSVYLLSLQSADVRGRENYMLDVPTILSTLEDVQARVESNTAYFEKADLLGHDVFSKRIEYPSRLREITVGEFVDLEKKYGEVFQVIKSEHERLLKKYGNKR